MKAGVQWLVNAFGHRAKARRVALAYRQQLNPRGENGRLILRDLALYANGVRSSFTPGDSHATAFGEGQRDVYLHVLQMLGVRDHDLMMLLGEEADDD